MKKICKKTTIISGAVLVFAFLIFIAISASKKTNNTIAFNETEMIDDTYRQRFEMTGNQELVDWYRFKDSFDVSIQTKVWKKNRKEIDDPCIY